MNNRKFRLYWLIYTIALLVFIVPFHHHSDGADHPECNICIIANQQACTPEYFLLKIFILFLGIITSFKIILFQKTAFSIFFRHAPPTYNSSF